MILTLFAQLTYVNVLHWIVYYIIMIAHAPPPRHNGPSLIPFVFKLSMAL